MPKIAKNEVFGHFFKFGWFDWSDIAYSDDKKRTQVLMLVRMDFILHISIVLSGVYYLAIMLDHSKVTKLHF